MSFNRVVKYPRVYGLPVVVNRYGRYSRYHFLVYYSLQEYLSLNIIHYS